MLDQLKIAIVCDWLTVYAGAERVLQQIHELFPKAPIYTSLFDSKRCSVFKDADVRESNLKYLPYARKAHRIYFPLMLQAFEKMDFSEYDLVISSSHSAAKGIITKPETLHVSYCHSPMRYVWDRSHAYQEGFKSFSPFRAIYKPLLHKIRMWDRVAAERVDVFISNSHYIARRVEKYYDRPSEVIHPPVDLSRFTLSKERGESYLAVGRLIPYKRFDLLIKASNSRKFPLQIVGQGPEGRRLKRLAGPQVEFLGQVDEETLIRCYQNAKALLFPQVEDFGIVPLEAMATGTPILAFSQGGIMETVKENESGIFFHEQSVAAIEKAISQFEGKKWDPEKVAASVDSFSNARFKSEFRHALSEAWKQHQEMLGSKR